MSQKDDDDSDFKNLFEQIAENSTIERRKTLTITEHDLKILISGIATKLKDELHSDFAIEHYDQHKALLEILTLTNNVKNSFLKYILGLLFLGASILIGLGVVGHK